MFCNLLCVLLWLEGDHKFIVAAATFSSFCWHRGANSAVPILALQYENQPRVFLYIAKKAIRHQHLGTTIKVFLLLTSDFGRWPSWFILIHHYACYAKWSVYTTSWEEILLHLIVTIKRCFLLIDISGSLPIAAQPQLRLWHADFEHRVLESLFIPRVFHISVHRLAVHIWIYLGIQLLFLFTFSCVWTDESTVLYTSGVQFDINLWVLLQVAIWGGNSFCTSHLHLYMSIPLADDIVNLSHHQPVPVWGLKTKHWILLHFWQLRFPIRFRFWPWLPFSEIGIFQK